VGGELEVVDDGDAGLLAAADAEGEDAAEAALEVLLGRVVGRVALEARVRDPRHLLVLFEPARQRERVADVALDAERERLEALDQLEGAERVEAGAQVAQDLDAHPDRERDRPERVIEPEPVVALRRLRELREACRVSTPVELAGVDDDAGDGCAVAADPLGGRVDNDVGTCVGSLLG